MSDLIYRKAAIDAVWSLDAELRPSAIDAILNMLNQLPSAQPRHKVRFGDADHVWIDGKQYISLQRFGEAVKDAQSQRIKGRMNDFISRREAIDALWKALYAYEDKMEKQFQESDELDVSDWIEHRIFVQNMSDIDRQTILALPSVQRDTDEWCHDCSEYDHERHCCPRWNRVIRETLKDAQPERKRGHWIEVNDSYNRISGRCSVCGWESHMYEDDVVGMNYCPNCGARMEVEHD